MSHQALPATWMRQGWQLSPAAALVMFCLTNCLAVKAQGVLAPAHRAALLGDALPDAPDAPGDAQALATLSGTVTDKNGALLAGATVTLENMQPAGARTALSDGNGFFRFTAVPPGTYKITVSAKGFATLVQAAIPVQTGHDLDLPTIVLPIGSATTDVQVIYTEHELAEQQLKAEEKQRVFAIFPNFYSSYVWHAAPLSAGQKMRLAWKSAIDPVAFLAAGATAGVEQWQNVYSGYGQGAQGFGKRFGAAYADSFDGSIIGDGVFPVLFRQDPRFYYKADGTWRQKTLYAVSTTVIRKGDNGRWQANYSGILGNLASGAVSNLYYPAVNRKGATTTFENAGLGIMFGAIGAVLREFVTPIYTSGGPHHKK